MIVIADDITGAAEIAGMASDGTKVIATDTRSLTQEEAVAETNRIVEKHKLTKDLQIFKKTDSALRGHIVAELSVLMQKLGYSKCLLLPQNPSKGRIIRGGKYYINNVLLHETSFKFDPEYPANRSDVTEMMHGCHYLSLDSQLKEGINIAEATCTNDIIIQLAKADEDTLLAGAADLFRTICNKNIETSNFRDFDIPKPLLIICGSTQSKSLATEPVLESLGAVEIPMKSDVFHGEASIDSWIETLKKAYLSSQALIMTIGHEPVGGKDYAVRLREDMAIAAAELCNVLSPHTIIIEGGATAFAVLSALGWTQFDMEHEFAPGVVALRHEVTDKVASLVEETIVVLKPGSYPWGGIFQ